MRRQAPDNQDPAPEGALEVELPELPREASGSVAAAAARREAMVSELRKEEARRSEMARAVAETPDPAADLSAIGWKSFVAVGALSALYFLSLAVTDPINFREGSTLLWRALLQIAAAAATWAVFLRACRGVSPDGRKLAKKIFLGFVLALLLVLAAAALGLAGPGRRVWTSGAFLFSLAVEVSAAIYLVRVRKRLLERIEFGDTVPPYSRLLVFVSEGLLLYLGAGIFLQATIHLHTPMILVLAVSRPGTFTLFSCPFVGYVILRNLTAVS